MKVKIKDCIFCGTGFTPFKTTQRVCSTRCAVGYAQEKEAKKEKAERAKDTKARKVAIMTHKDWLNLLQKVFNTYIRMRDKGQPCISCGCKVENGHASHMFSVGGNPNVRFNEDNCHLSCVECNLHKHGNLVEYALRLPERIGKERFEKLVNDSRKTVLKLSIPEIENLIKVYKEKIKQFK